MAERGWSPETVNGTPLIELSCRSVNHSRDMGVWRRGERFYGLHMPIGNVAEDGQRR
jgi:hypothetical protein